MKKALLVTLTFLFATVAFSQQWVQQNSTVTTALGSILFIDADTGVASGGSGGIIVRTVDGGANWNLVSTPTNEHLAKMSYVNSNVIYAVGDDGAGVKSTDGGITWNAMGTGTSVILRGVHFTDANTGFHCGQSEKLGKTTDGGATWSIQDFGPYWLRDFYFTSSSTGYVVGDGGHMYKTIDGGTSWSAMTSGTSENLNSVWFPTLDTGYAVGLNGKVVKTTNAGSSWSSVNSGTTEVLRDLYFFDGYTGYIVGYNGTILYTTDGGTTWTPENSGTTDHIAAITFIDGVGYCSGFNGVILKKGCPPPDSDFTFSSNGLITSFSSTSTGTSYLWDFGDGDFSSLANPNHNYTNPGTYTVCLTITDACGTDSTCTSITVNNCLSPTADFSSTDTLLDVSFTNNSTVSGTTTFWWDFGDGNFSSQANPSNLYATSGTYWVCLTVTDTCGTDSTCAFITVDNCTNPVADFLFTDNGNGDIQFSDNSSAAPGSTFWWDFGDGNFSTLTNPDNVYSIDGTYTVCLTITDSCGTDTTCQNITISGLGVNEHYNNQNVTIFPNPFSDHTIIQIENGKGNYTVELYDITGRMVTSENYKNTNTLTIDRKSLEAGTYLYRIVQNNSTIVSGKLMVVD
jgi:PKD repeat protein